LVEEAFLRRLEPEFMSNVLVLPAAPAFAQPEMERAAG